MSITFRPLGDADLEQVFAWEKDAAAVEMAAFTRADPSDRAAFDAHNARVAANPQNLRLAIEDDGVFVGTVASFWTEGEREVSYWIDPARWGRGIASAALRSFLLVERTRPLVGRVAAHNLGSAKVLEHAGFVRIGQDSGYAEGIGRETVEFLYRFDGTV
ncbi:MAG TPA: GNAT family N-acetyltransferase [Marmoricola sp.]